LEWFAYGRPRLPSNLYSEDFVKTQGRIRVTTNIEYKLTDTNPLNQTTIYTSRERVFDARYRTAPA
jgi:hypothetical protein